MGSAELGRHCTVVGSFNSAVMQVSRPFHIFLAVASLCLVLLLEDVNCFIPQADLPKGCISEARVLGGNMAPPNGPVKNVAELEDCIKLCQETEGCSSISYNKNRQCKRKPEDLNLFNREDNVKWVTCHKDAYNAGDGCEPDPCNGKGACLEGSCFCFEGYIGDNCETELAEEEPEPDAEVEDQSAEDFELVSPHTEGVASNCENLGCSTESGGLAACQNLCRDQDSCTLINFCPAGATCTSGLNRCCRRKCSGTDYQLVDRWEGWDVYIKSGEDDQTDAVAVEETEDHTACKPTFVLESPWTSGKALFCNDLKSHFISCTTESGGLAASKKLCEKNRRCTTISFIPDGADGTSGPNRCCMQGCGEDDFKMDSRDKGWDVYRISRPAAQLTWALESPWESGKALFCNDFKADFISCTTESGGLDACKKLCESNSRCTTINFIPEGADGISGLNRCCLQGCSETNFKMDSKHKGWDVYRLSSPTCDPGCELKWTLESPWTSGKALFCNNFESDFISCTTESGGLAACKQKCEENTKCTTISFIPEGADGTSGLNRCCLNGCSETDFKMDSKHKGWDVYRITRPSCHLWTLESPWTSGKALFCNNFESDFISCTTESGGLAACKQKCEENTK